MTERMSIYTYLYTYMNMRAICLCACVPVKFVQITISNLFRWEPFSRLQQEKKERRKRDNERLFESNFNLARNRNRPLVNKV